MAVAFSRTGYRLATGSTDQTIQLWDANTGAHIMCVTKRAAGIYDLQALLARRQDTCRRGTVTARSGSGRHEDRVPKGDRNPYPAVVHALTATAG